MPRALVQHHVRHLGVAAAAHERVQNLARGSVTVRVTGRLTARATGQGQEQGARLRAGSARGTFCPFWASLYLPISPYISLYLAYISPTYRVALAVVLELQPLVLVRDEHVLRGPRLVRVRVRVRSRVRHLDRLEEE